MDGEGINRVVDFLEGSDILKTRPTCFLSSARRGVFEAKPGTRSC